METIEEKRESKTSRIAESSQTGGHESSFEHDKMARTMPAVLSSRRYEDYLISQGRKSMNKVQKQVLSKVDEEI